jgi:hypothetical protein
MRFVASMLMHFNVEKDVRNGLLMMKYIVNHSDHFNRPVDAFVICFLSTVTSQIIELTVILVLTSIRTTLEVIMKYVSLAAIANIPRFYYGALLDNVLLLGKESIRLDPKNFRKDNIERDCIMSCGRVIHKTLRILYCCWSYYFMPFTAMFMTYLASEVKKGKQLHATTAHVHVKA